MTKNTLQQQRAQSSQAKISVFLNSEAVKNKINELVGGKDGQRFIASIVSAVSTNPQLQSCDNATILSAALLGESLKLSPSPQLGHYYFVPFADNKAGRTVATFVLGYKGYLQLAIRSGQYKNINVLAIKEGELKGYNPLTEEIDVNINIDDWDEREAKATIGYYATFELVNGFKKSIYWSRKQMEKHALNYSKGYKAKKGYTFWEKDFDGMAYKTMLRQLISKWGIMSIEMQTAFTSDNSFQDLNGQSVYVEDEAAEIPVEHAKVVEAEAVEVKEPDEQEEPEPSFESVENALFGREAKDE